MNAVRVGERRAEKSTDLEWKGGWKGRTNRTDLEWKEDGRED
jgi:hypothetical protein